MGKAIKITAQILAVSFLLFALMQELALMAGIYMIAAGVWQLVAVQGGE